MESILLQSAGAFTIDALTRIYNESRRDYMISMSMTIARMRRYLDIYDVVPGHSVVAMKGEAACGIGMLGVRDGVSWITRLGVMPAGRRSGVGRKIVRHLLSQARALGQNCVKLEVIQGNEPAYRMFRSFGFQPGETLMILKRETMPTFPVPSEKKKWLKHADALNLLEQFSLEQPWTLQSATYRNSGDALGLRCHLEDGTSGWVVYRRQPDRLSHFVFHTIRGDPERLAAAGITAIGQAYPGMLARVENIYSSDPHLPVLLRAGFEIDFKRTEMVKTVSEIKTETP